MKIFYSILFLCITGISLAQTADFDNISFNNPQGNQDFITGQYKPLIYGSRSGGSILGGSSSLILQTGYSTHSNRHMFFRTRDLTRMFIHSNGNIGIGTTEPVKKLDVNGSIRVNKEIDMYGLISSTGSNGSFIQLTTLGHAGSHGLLFNSLKTSGSISGSLMHNILYANHKGDYKGGAGAIIFQGNYGVMDFLISKESSGQGDPVDWDGIKMRILRNGNIGIGTISPDAKLAVNGDIKAKEVKVTLDGWPDFVFEENYELKSLQEVESFIKEHKHLPDIPSEKEVMENGLDLGGINSKLLQKIEELTLYIIQQEKEIKKYEYLEKKLQAMEHSLDLVKQQYDGLKK